MRFAVLQKAIRDTSCCISIDGGCTTHIISADHSFLCEFTLCLNVNFVWIVCGLCRVVNVLNDSEPKPSDFPLFGFGKIDVVVYSDYESLGVAINKCVTPTCSARNVRVTEEFKKLIRHSWA